MRGKKFVIRKQEMMILFNSLIELGYDKNLEFSVPMLENLILFRLRLDGGGVHISDFITYDDYSKIYFSLSRKMKERAKDEIPSYGDIQQAFYQAGVLKPEGLTQLERVISDLKAQNVVKGGDVYHIALDTNLLRDRFYSTYLSRISPHPNMDYILCETVRDELKNRQDKFRKSVLRGMNPLKYHILEDCFLNQNSLDDRLRYIGFLEYNRMRAATSCEEIDSPSAKSGMQNDRIILETYSNFVDVGRKVIFISRDNETVRMMTGEGNVIPILIEHPQVTQQEFQAPWDRFFALLYLLGILYGKLHIIVGGVEVGALKSVWSQKDVKEWEEDFSLLEIFAPRPDDKEELKEYHLIIKRLKMNLAILGSM